ncbi:ABC transporter permease [Advenella sp. WQ 585]|uniref:ABC transporter permease n=1 Tax=Advenella mandrilli TaxID=2800330 RepID=A0ABS1EAP8_9BURK|nr:ABC transporter permease [Advenella mandrilli]MBK1780005.1 ABC transporter permease [Advenella mandrilli]
MNNKVQVLEKTPTAPGESLLREWVSAFFASKLATIGLVVAVILALAAIFAPWITPQDPYDLLQLDILDSRLPPGSENGLGTFTYLLGTDGQGRDLLSAIIYGLRISLMVGLGSALIASVVGTIVGVISAYFGGKVDAFIMRTVDLMLSFPSILIAMMILAYLGKGIGNVILTLVVLEWAYYARTARGQALAERQKEYVEAALNLAIPQWRIMLRHILPNCLPPLIVIGTLQVARAITLEATMSFLGLGVPITEPSLGLLISNGYQYMLSGQFWISMFPGLTLLLTIVSLNLVGDRLREIFNPRSFK